MHCVLPPKFPVMIRPRLAATASLPTHKPLHAIGRPRPSRRSQVHRYISLLLTAHSWRIAGLLLVAGRGTTWVIPFCESAQDVFYATPICLVIQPVPMPQCRSPWQSVRQTALVGPSLAPWLLTQPRWACIGSTTWTSSRPWLSSMARPLRQSSSSHHHALTTRQGRGSCLRWHS